MLLENAESILISMDSNLEKMRMKVKVKGKAAHYRRGQTQRVLRKLRFPDFVTTVQDCGRLSALRTGRL